MRVSLIQDSPVLFDMTATLDKVKTLAALAAKERPDIILFPEAFIPAYPRGLTFGTVVGSRSEEGRETWLRYWKNCPQVPGDETAFLGEVAKAHGVYLIIGVVERGDTGTLYCTILYFDPTGKLIGKHRKLKPTAAERVIWGEGDGDDLEVYDTPIGKIGGLVCWENYMPNARMKLYQQGVEIYCAPTADHRETWQHTMRHIALEGRCFVLGCNQYVEKSEYPDLPGEDYSTFPDIMSKGGSVIVDPLGNLVAGPLFDERGILTADLDMDLIAKGKMDFDVAGHYLRKDV